MESNAENELRNCVSLMFLSVFFATLSFSFALGMMNCNGNDFDLPLSNTKTLNNYDDDLKPPEIVHSI